LRDLGRTAIAQADGLDTEEEVRDEGRSQGPRHPHAEEVQDAARGAVADEAAQ
jgi:hypothetical protein